MTDDRGTVHVTFGPSRSQSIRDALRLGGCEERVISLPGSLNFGPIDPPDPDVRRQWIANVLRCDADDDRSELESPWEAATSLDVRPVYWVCMSDVGEHACFLEFVHRMAGRPFDIVDATGLEVATQNGISTPRSLGAMRVEDIVASGVRSRQREFTRAESNAALSAWSSLRHENAPLRIIRDGRLVSVPLTHFDALLVSQATSQWTVAARIIGLAMQQLSFDVDGPGQNPGDLFLFGRLLALGIQGDLDVKGIGQGMRDYQVRHPPVNRPRF